MVGEVFTDLLVHGDGLELVERDIQPAEVGHSPAECEDPVIAVIRDGHAHTYRDVPELRTSDRLVVVGSKPRVPASERQRAP